MYHTMVWEKKIELKIELALYLNKLEFPSAKDDLCQVWLKLAMWFWRRRWKCEKFTDWRTDDGRQVIRKAHLSFQLMWAKNRINQKSQNQNSKCNISSIVTRQHFSYNYHQNKYGRTQLIPLSSFYHTTVVFSSRSHKIDTYQFFQSSCLNGPRLSKQTGLRVLGFWSCNGNLINKWIIH